MLLLVLEYVCTTCMGVCLSSCTCAGVYSCKGELLGYERVDLLIREMSGDEFMYVSNIIGAWLYECVNLNITAYIWLSICRVHIYEFIFMSICMRPCVNAYIRGFYSYGCEALCVCICMLFIWLYVYGLVLCAYTFAYDSYMCTVLCVSIHMWFRWLSVRSLVYVHIWGFNEYMCEVLCVCIYT